MRFKKTRGRPRVTKQKNDLGTPELQRRHAQGETKDPLDVCLERGLITKEQHWCGVHLAWLYCLRFGVPQVRAVDFTDSRGQLLRKEDVVWQNAREQEYREAVTLLRRCCAHRSLQDLCVHRMRPQFLDLNTGRPSAQRLAAYAADVENIQEGLDALAKHWGRSQGRINGVYNDN